MKYLIVTLFLLLFTNNFIMADCVTGYACSLKDISEQNREHTDSQENSQKQKENKTETNNRKNDSIFVDGKENNKPQYTEMFTLRGIIP